MANSKSNATTSTTTNNIDQRLQLESGALGVSASGGSNVTVNTLDGGAIEAAFGLGNHAIDQVTDFATGALSGAAHTAELALSGALNSVAGARDAYEGATKEVAKAYEDAKVGNRSMYMVGALAVGAVLLVVVLQRRKN